MYTKIFLSILMLSMGFLSSLSSVQSMETETNKKTNKHPLDDAETHEEAPTKKRRTENSIVEVNAAPLQDQQRLDEVLSQVPDELWLHIASLYNENYGYKYRKRNDIAGILALRATCHFFFNYFTKDDAHLPGKLEEVCMLNLILRPNLKVLTRQPYHMKDEAITHFTNLEQLKVCGNSFRKNLHLIPKLRKLSLAHNTGITNESLSYLTNLTTVDIEENPKYICQNPITSEGISCLTNLTKLNLKRNTTIDGEGFSCLTNLKKLSLLCNEFFDNDALQHMTFLTYLDLTMNETISDQSVSHLTNLETLILGAEFAVSDISLNLLTNLTDLQFEVNHDITDGAVSKLTKLKSLMLADNQSLTDASISCLTNLTSLELGENEEITGDGILPLKELNYLNLGRNNEITDREISQLSGLTALNLDQNRTITAHSVSLLTNLTWLDLGWNENISKNDLTCLANLKIILKV